MIKNLSAKYQQLNLQISLYSPYKFTLDKSTELTSGQLGIWQFLNQYPDKVYRETYEGGNVTRVTVALADIMNSQTCINCHNNHEFSQKKDWKLGDVRGVLQMNVDISRQMQEGISLTYAITIALIILLAAVLGLSYLMIEKEKLEVKLYFSATHDLLTGLNNRFNFAERLELALKVAKRKASHAALFYIDLDGFKEINDTYGHDAGDYCLKEVALRLTHISREVDTVARFGGDEFVMLFCDFEPNGFIQDAAARINQSIAEPFIYHGEKFTLSCSIGIALTNSRKDKASTLIKNADLAMYRAKNSGKNSYHIYDKG